MNARRFLCFLCGILAATIASAQRPDIIVSTILHDDGTKTVSTRKISERQMEQLTYSTRGVVTMKRLFRTDHTGKVRSGIAWDGAGNYLFRFQYTFDDLDRLSKEETYNEKNVLVRVMNSTYDQQGRPTRQAVSYPKLAKNIDPKLLDHPSQLRGKELPGDQSQAIAPKKL